MKKIYALIAISLILVGCDLFSKRVEVEYFVTCTAIPNFVHTEIYNGGDTTFFDQPTPWSYTFTARSGDYVWISAMNAQDHGSVTVVIYVDDEVFDGSTCTGSYCSAWAYGTIP